VARLLIACVARVSGTFLARRIRALVAELELLPVGVLPETAFRTGGAEAAVTQARELLRAASYRGVPTAESKE
jgi:hypothetical protein